MDGHTIVAVLFVVLTLAHPIVATNRLFSRSARSRRRTGRHARRELSRIGVAREVYALPLGDRDVGFYQQPSDLTIWEGPVHAAIHTLAALPDEAGFDAFAEAFDRTPALRRVA
jgi:hypothetical protein